MKRVAIIMYHHILGENDHREGMKGITKEKFEEHLRYFSGNMNVVTTTDLVNYYQYGQPLPPKAVMLTFDDGYASHFKYAFSLLKRYGIKASFYPSAMPVHLGKALEVNKIHLVLGKIAPCDILRQLTSIPECREYVTSASTPAFKKFLTDYYPLDNEDVALVKYLLQTGLPVSDRKERIDFFFKEVLGLNEFEFVQTFYMSLSELRELTGWGMEVGVHGYTHRWLTELDATEQKKEIMSSVRFIRDCGHGDIPLSISYPSGVYNDQLIGFLSRMNFDAGFTVHPAIADLDTSNPLTLPRLDAAALKSSNVFHQIHHS